MYSSWLSGPDSSVLECVWAPDTPTNHIWFVILSHRLYGSRTVHWATDYMSHELYIEPQTIWVTNCTLSPDTPICPLKYLWIYLSAPNVLIRALNLWISTPIFQNHTYEWVVSFWRAIDPPNCKYWRRYSNIQRPNQNIIIFHLVFLRGDRPTQLNLSICAEYFDSGAEYLKIDANISKPGLFEGRSTHPTAPPNIFESTIDPPNCLWGGYNW